MDPLTQQVTSTFEDNGWAFHQVEGAEVVEAGFEAHHTKVQLHVQAFPQLNGISVVSESVLLFSDPDWRAKVAELLMRVNQTLTVGSFEMVWDLGRPVYRVTNMFPRDHFDSSILTTMVEATIVEMDRLTPLLSVISKASPMELAQIDIEALMRREDLVPDVEEPQS